MPLGFILGGTGAAALFGTVAAVDAGVGVYNAIEAHQLASSAEGRARITFGEQQQYEQQLMQLIKDPSSVSSLPGYKFQFEQGSDAVAREMAAGGYLGSGNEAAGLIQYGQGLAQNFYTTQADLLARLSGLAPSSPSQYGGNAVAAQGSSANQFQNMFGELGLLAGLYGRGMFSSSGTPAATATAGTGGASSTFGVPS